MMITIRYENKATFPKNAFRLRITRLQRAYRSSLSRSNIHKKLGRRTKTLGVVALFLSLEQRGHKASP